MTPSLTPAHGAALRTHRSHPVARALMCLAALALPLQGLHAQSENPNVRLPALGESAAEDFTVSVERRLGEQIMGEIRRDPDFLDDPVLQAYLQALWLPLVQTAKARGDIESDTALQFSWEAFLVRDKSVNAFALPGGFVGVHLGLIAMTATRDELASVLAHELTHVTQRHIARSIANQSRQTLLGMAGMILAVLAASRSNNADAAQAAIAGSQAAMIQGQLNFSRDMEREADRIGQTVMAGAGFDPAGMPAMFDKMDQVHRINDSGAFPYLRSHPLTLERQSEARLRMSGGTTAAPAAAARSPWPHALMAARSRVLMDAGVVGLRRLQTLPTPRAGQGPADRAGALYASALAASLLREHEQARTRVRELRDLLAEQAAPDPAATWMLALLEAETRLAAGDAAGTMALVRALPMDAAPAGFPGLPRALLLLHANAAVQSQGAGREAALRISTEALQTWVTAHPRDAGAWLMLGNSAEALGQRLRALRAQAEARLLVGDMTGAIDRLRNGRTLARNAAAGQEFIEASIIDARLRELEALRRQLAAEARGRRGDSPDSGRDGSEPPRQQ